MATVETLTPEQIALMNAAALAIQLQDACNSKAILLSLLDARHAIIAYEAALPTEQQGTDQFNRHPVLVMYLSKLGSLAGMGGGDADAFSKAYRDCRCLASGQFDLNQPTGEEIARRNADLAYLAGHDARDRLWLDRSTQAADLEGVVTIPVTIVDGEAEAAVFLDTGLRDFDVVFEKSYVHESKPEVRETIQGVMRFRAISAQNALAAADRLLSPSTLEADSRPMQSNDPRITWDNLEVIDPEEAEYEDFSFGTTGETLDPNDTKQDPNQV